MTGRLTGRDQDPHPDLDGAPARHPPGPGRRERHPADPVLRPSADTRLVAWSSTSADGDVVVLWTQRDAADPWPGRAGGRTTVPVAGVLRRAVPGRPVGAVEQPEACLHRPDGGVPEAAPVRGRGCDGVKGDRALDERDISVHDRGGREQAEPLDVADEVAGALDRLRPGGHAARPRGAAEGHRSGEHGPGRQHPRAGGRPRQPASNRRRPSPRRSRGWQSRCGRGRAGTSPCRARPGRSGRTDPGWPGRTGPQTVRSAASLVVPEQLPAEPVGRRGHPGQSALTSSLQEPPASVPRTSSSPVVRIGVRHGAAQVGEAGRAPGEGHPRGQQVRHRGPGVEGVAEAGQRHTGGAGPPQLGLAVRRATAGPTASPRWRSGRPSSARRDRPRRSSPATCGTMPTDTASTATSKSSPATRVSVPVPGAGPQCDSRSSPGSPASWSTSGRPGQQGSPPTRISGS